MGNTPNIDSKDLLMIGNSVSWGIGGIFITEEAALNGQ